MLKCCSKVCCLMMIAESVCTIKIIDGLKKLKKLSSIFVVSREVFLDYGFPFILCTVSGITSSRSAINI